MNRFFQPGSFKEKKNDTQERSTGETSKGSKSSLPKPWVEKYRPKSVKEVVQQNAVAVLKNCLDGNGDLLNLLFYGPPGTGKTSTILAFAKEIFGDMYKSRILELNASDERGINVIREKVKTFSQQTASAIKIGDKTCPSFKIVILDEADSMTNAAQAALRRIMEKETKSTRFCIICNYVSRIIGPIISRCAKFRFKPLSTESAVERLEFIANEEGVEYEPGVLESIVETSEGDLRRAITFLQCAHKVNTDGRVTIADIAETASIVPEDWINGIIKVCQSNSYEKLEAYVTNIFYEGYTSFQIISQLHDVIINDPDLNCKQKSHICEKIAVCDKRLLCGADEYLQLMDICSLIMTQICHPS